MYSSSRPSREDRLNGISVEPLFWGMFMFRGASLRVAAFGAIRCCNARRTAAYIKLFFSLLETNRLQSQSELTLGFVFHDRIDRLCFSIRHMSGAPSCGNAFVLDTRLYTQHKHLRAREGAMIKARNGKPGTLRPSTRKCVLVMRIFSK